MATKNAVNWKKRFAEIRQKAITEGKDIQKHFFEPGIRVLGVSGSARDQFDMAQEDSTSEWLLSKCLDEAKKSGAETKLLSLRKYDIRPCKACYSTTNAQCHFKCTCYPQGEKGDDMTNKIYDMCMWADVIVFATPVNNFKMSSFMALFIDRLISMDGSLSPADPSDPKNKELNKLHTEYIEKHSSDEYGSGFLRRFLGKIGGIIVSGHEAGAGITISSLFLTLNYYGFLFPPFSSVYAVGDICEGTRTDIKKLRSPCYEEDARSLARNLITAAKIAKRKNDYWWDVKSSIN